jgi:7,8-dihydroneopterin aldolase/epimerase/oxygenase
MGTIYLENIQLFSHHGCLEEETVIGSDYRVDLWIDSSLEKASKSDALEDTVDYVYLNRVVEEEMAIASKLLEHVGQRIINRIFSESLMVQKIKISIAKVNPPIGGHVASVSVIMKQVREE